MTVSGKCDWVLLDPRIFGPARLRQVTLQLQVTVLYFEGKMAHLHTTSCQYTVGTLWDMVAMWATLLWVSWWCSFVNG